MVVKHKDAMTIMEPTGCGKMYVVCVHEHGRLRAVDITLGKNGSCAACHLSTLQGALNELLRLGGNVNNLINITEGQNCHKGNCCVNGVAEALKIWNQKMGVVPK